MVIKSATVSPSLIEGVDDNNPKNIYCFVKGNTTINPEQVSQQIARNGNLSAHIWIYAIRPTIDQYLIILKILFNNIEGKL